MTDAKKAAKAAQTLFGKRLFDAREALHYTRRELGQILGVTETTVFRLETGRQALRWELLIRIFSSLGQPPAYYFSADMPPIPAKEPTPAEAITVIEAALKTLTEEAERLRKENQELKKKG